jgi:hypothetical protein
VIIKENACGVKHLKTKLQLVQAKRYTEMALLLKTDGTTRRIFPMDKKEGFTLAEIYEAISCKYMEIVSLNPMTRMIVDEDGQEKNLPVNTLATILHWQHGGYPYQVVGDVLIADKWEVQ